MTLAIMNNSLNNQMRVLVVEDDPIVQIVHRSMLEKLGCIVDLAVNGMQTLQKASNGYDLIFMDIGLPDKSGIAVTAEIRQQQHVNSKYVPIIALTAYTHEEVQNECLAAGADEVFTKPIKLDAFGQILNRYSN